MTASTAKAIVPQANAATKKALPKAHTAKLLTGLELWRASLTAEDREALNERNRQTHCERWKNMSERERKDRLAGVRAWQKEQRAKKRAAAKAKPAPKVDPKKAPPKPSSATEVSESAVPARACRTGKAVAK